MRIFVMVILCLIIILSSVSCKKAGESSSPSPSLTPAISATPSPSPTPTASAVPSPTVIIIPAPTMAPTPVLPSETPPVTPEPTAIQPSASPEVNTPIPAARDIEYFYSIKKAQSAFGSNFKYPSLWPQDFFEEYIAIVNKNTVEIVYKKGNDELVYRVKAGSSNISGDFNIYESVDTVDANGISVIIKSNGGVAFLALWESDNYSYSLRAANGISMQELQNVAASVK